MSRMSARDRAAWIVSDLVQALRWLSLATGTLEDSLPFTSRECVHGAASHFARALTWGAGR